MQCFETPSVTKKDTVNEVLREYIQRRRQAKVVELFGKIDFDSPQATYVPEVHS